MDISIAKLSPNLSLNPADGLSCYWPADLPDIQYRTFKA